MAMNKNFPLIVEPYPEDYDGYQFLTVIKYNDKSYLAVIDNMCKKFIHAYVVDLCSPLGMDELALIELVDEWYETNSSRYPISVHFSKLGLTEVTQGLYIQFPVNYVTRVIGPLPNFCITGPSKVRKRKRRDTAPQRPPQQKTRTYV